MAEYWAETNQAGLILDKLGTHWSSFYRDNGFVEALIEATDELEKQTRATFNEAVALLGRETAPLFHTQNWYALTVRQSELTRSTLKYGDGYSYGSTWTYGATLSSDSYDFVVPDTLNSAGAVVNKLRDPSLLWLPGIDFVVEDGLLKLRSNPFETADFPKEEVFEDGVLADFETTLWLFKSQWDWNYLYDHVGYVLGLKLPATQAALDTLNVLMDAVIEGTNRGHIEKLFSAITGTPLCKTTGETVELITADRNNLIVATDSSVYLFPTSATAIVSVGDVLAEGDSLVDTLQFFDLQRGECPDELTSLEIGANFLSADYVSGVIFKNTDVPLVITEGDTTTVSFELGGFPTDVDAFWETVDASGETRGYTLAQTLDTRPAPLASEPTAATLPATINPLSFLVENVLRGNALAVSVKANQLSGGLGLNWLWLVQEILPPWQTIFVVVDLEVDDDSITLAGDDAPVPYDTNPVTDEIDLTEAADAPSLRGIQHYCL